MASPSLITFTEVFSGSFVIPVPAPKIANGPPTLALSTACTPHVYSPVSPVTLYNTLLLINLETSATFNRPVVISAGIVILITSPCLIYKLYFKALAGVTSSAGASHENITMPLEPDTAFKLVGAPGALFAVIPSPKLFFIRRVCDPPASP